jgi:hypothetical protein
MKKTELPKAEETREELRIVALGEQAIDNLKRTFDHWLAIGRGIEAGREFAMRVTQTDDVDNKFYRNVFGDWLGRHPKYRVVKKATMSWLKKCLDHETDIQAWRAGNVAELAYVHYPEAVFKHWAKSQNPSLLTEKQQAAGSSKEGKGTKRSGRHCPLAA